MSSGVKGPSAQVYGTLGMYRYLLTSIIVAVHVGPMDLPDSVGGAALFSLFLVSGYAVTHILRSTYLQQLRGVVKFIVNRALRVFPIYWVVLALSYVLVAVYPEHLGATGVAYLTALPGTWWEWVANISTFGITHPLNAAFIPGTILPPAWTIGVEMFWWLLLIVLLQSRRLRIACLVFAASYMVITSYMSFFRSLDVGWCFRSWAAPALTFMTGMYMCLYKSRMRVGFLLAFPFAVLIVLNLASGHEPAMSWWAVWGYFVSTVGAWTLTHVDPSKLPRVVGSLDQWMGDITYGIYLLHVPVAIALNICFPELGTKNTAMFLACLVCSSMVAELLQIVVQRPVNRIRDRIAQRHKRGTRDDVDGMAVTCSHRA
jgi:peptidoglycan/LPS O-acetylase OafA/YrhL